MFQSLFPGLRRFASDLFSQTAGRLIGNLEPIRDKLNAVLLPGSLSKDEFISDVLGHPPRIPIERIAIPPPPEFTIRIVTPGCVLTCENFDVFQVSPLALARPFSSKSPLIGRSASTGDQPWLNGDVIGDLVESLGTAAPPPNAPMPAFASDHKRATSPPRQGSDWCR